MLFQYLIKVAEGLVLLTMMGPGKAGKESWKKAGRSYLFRVIFMSRSKT